jgi:hypothetical protein
LRLSFVQRLKLALFGYVSVGFRVKPGWRAPIEHYAFYCKKHGLVVDYRHGFAGRLECPLCFEETEKVG